MKEQMVDLFDTDWEQTVDLIGIDWLRRVDWNDIGLKFFDLN